MNAIQNTGLLNLFQAVSFAGFGPSVAYSLSGTTLTVTDNTTYPGGDGLKILQITITDREGATVYANTTTTGSGGAAAVSVSTLSAAGGFAVKATVVTNNGLLADLGVYGVGSTAPAAGNLQYANMTAE